MPKIKGLALIAITATFVGCSAAYGIAPKQVLCFDYATRQSSYHPASEGCPLGSYPDKSAAYAEEEKSERLIQKGIDGGLLGGAFVVLWVACAFLWRQRKRFARPSTEHFEEALAELDSPERKQGLWARAISDNQGDEAKARAAYLKLRAAQIRREK